MGSERLVIGDVLYSCRFQAGKPIVSRYVATSESHICQWLDESGSNAPWPVKGLGETYFRDRDQAIRRAARWYVGWIDEEIRLLTEHQSEAKRILKELP